MFVGDKHMPGLLRLAHEVEHTLFRFEIEIEIGFHAAVMRMGLSMVFQTLPGSIMVKPRVSWQDWQTSGWMNW